MLSQKLQQKLQQKLAPQQILLMKLLQLPALSLEHRVKQELEQNPVLEETENYEEEEPVHSEEENHVEETEEERNIDDYLQDDDVADYKLSSHNRNKDDEPREMIAISSETFQENLLNQLYLSHSLTERQLLIGKELIGNLDNAGYLQRTPEAMVDDFLFRQNISVSESEINTVLHELQKLDPAGVGARNLQECLLLQIRRKDLSDPAVALAETILNKSFSEFSKKHYHKLMSRLGCSEEELGAAIEQIVQLNPKPGSSNNTSTTLNPSIIPDFFVWVDDGEIEFRLNNPNLPELKISRYYTNMLENYASTDKKNKQQVETIRFIKDKIDSARWFIEAIHQRNNTLELTMKAIIDIQHDYFIEGNLAKMKPMKLKDVADCIKMDISTVSRVVSSKYAQTHFGTFLLKDFFSKSIVDEDGQDVSTDVVRNLLRKLIEEEDKTHPLTDTELMKLVQKEGYPLARRTIAKYREQLNIPVSRLRKEING